eukprot:scaffold23468_cov44-Attheya_sp.AAC.3
MTAIALLGHSRTRRDCVVEYGMAVEQLSSEKLQGIYYVGQYNEADCICNNSNVCKKKYRKIS